MGIFAAGSHAAHHAPGGLDPTNAVPRWTPTTAYLLGQQVVSPNNDVVSRSPHQQFDLHPDQLEPVWVLRHQGSGHGVIFRVGSGVVLDLVSQDEVGAGVAGVGGSQVLTEFGDGGGSPLRW
jgi:hypothetical protein